jgi:hypothetical protein
MASVEGAIRMRSAGKVIMLIGLTLTIVGAGILAMSWISLTRGAGAPPRMNGPNLAIMMPLGLMVFGYLGVLPQIIGAILWTSGWIVEGFLSRSRPE